ncbi:hypothetical protein I3842_13G161700 [Carya illinoinensis]|uniref:Uncharacterized protein n=1 Tax=Carya illinoinensis TaxID=32201 RepID=A0A922DED6_CARIL|nr:hypothetical protein I3842_13G161700 [Carya illinoinensis]
MLNMVFGSNWKCNRWVPKGGAFTGEISFHSNAWIIFTNSIAVTRTKGKTGEQIGL